MQSRPTEQDLDSQKVYTPCIPAIDYLRCGNLDRYKSVARLLRGNRRATPLSAVSRLESLVEAGLFQDRICGVTRLDRVIYGEALAGYWTVPELVVAFTLTDEPTTVLSENLFKFFGIC